MESGAPENPSTTPSQLSALRVGRTDGGSQSDRTARGTKRDGEEVAAPDAGRDGEEVAALDAGHNSEEMVSPTLAVMGRSGSVRRMALLEAHYDQNHRGRLMAEEKKVFTPLRLRSHEAHDEEKMEYDDRFSGERAWCFPSAARPASFDVVFFGSCRKFDLLKCIRFSTQVLGVEYLGATEEDIMGWEEWSGDNGKAFRARKGGGWCLTVKDLKVGSIEVRAIPCDTSYLSSLCL
ncbi:hypothetical protein ACQ4PT_024996 [Festuca glaucescens]